MRELKVAEDERRLRAGTKGQTIVFVASTGEVRTLTPTPRGRRYYFAPADDDDEAALDLHGVRLVGEEKAADEAGTEEG